MPATQTETKTKQRRSPWLLILLIVFFIFFMMTSALLGSQLYELATRDQYTVDFGMGEPDGSIELFRIEYANESGDITVRGVNGQDVVAPGTSVSYDIRLRNNDDVAMDFLMTPTVEFLTDDPVPVEFRIVDDYGNYILGSEDVWVGADAMNGLAHKGRIHPGEVFTYHVSWQWVFEVSDDQDAVDTFLGSQNGLVRPGVTVGISTEAVANPYAETKDMTHLTHLQGENFGCCWCCWLVWLLLLVCLLLSVWIFLQGRKLNKHEQTLKEYEAVLIRHGLMVGGELVK